MCVGVCVCVGMCVFEKRVWEGRHMIFFILIHAKSININAEHVCFWLYCSYTKVFVREMFAFFPPGSNVCRFL